MKEERKLKRVKISLMRNPLFAQWSGIMMIGETMVSDSVPTAMTNGRDEVYGRNFVKELSERELAFVVLHENLHKAFRHMTTWRRLAEENAMLANMAMDYVINQIIVDTDPGETLTAMPRGKDGKPHGLLDARFKGMNTKQVYDILKKQCKTGSGGKNEGGSGGSGGEDQDHGGFDVHDWEGAKELSETEKRTLEREIDQALRQGQMQAGKLAGNNAGNMSRELGELLKPQIDWREQLMEFVTQTCPNKDASSWRRVNRRYISSDIYMPSLIGERVGRVVVGVDTSGSIGGRELNTFLTEVKAIADIVRPEKIDLIYWDAAVAGHEVYDDSNMEHLIASTKPKGGGGTDPTVVKPFLKKEKIEPMCIIMLTDGYVPSWGTDWPAPIMWVVSNNPGATAPVGKTIHIKDWNE